MTPLSLRNTVPICVKYRKIKINFSGSTEVREVINFIAGREWKGK